MSWLLQFSMAGTFGRSDKGPMAPLSARSVFVQYLMLFALSRMNLKRCPITSQSRIMRISHDDFSKVAAYRPSIGPNLAKWSRISLALLMARPGAHEIFFKVPNSGVLQTTYMALFVSIYRTIKKNPLTSIAGDAFQGLTKLNKL